MTADGPNWIGLWTLYLREVRRFTKVYSQTMLAPMVTTLLFLAVFSLAFGGGSRNVGDIPFMTFLGPGLIMMAIAQNAFANTSSSLTISKIQGNIVDTLMPPFTATELVTGLSLGGATRGIAVGAFVALSMSFFVDLSISHPLYIIYHAFMASLMLALLGVLGGIWAEKFDHIAAVTNFIITPLSFLSGTFYSIERLPEFAKSLALVNPFFYMIDGFRYGFTGYADGPLMTGLLVLLLVNIILASIAVWLFSKGYRLKP